MIVHCEKVELVPTFPPGMAIPAPIPWLARKIDLQRGMRVSPVLMVLPKGAAASAQSVELNKLTDQGKGILSCAPVPNRRELLSAFLVGDPKLPERLVGLLSEESLLRRDYLLDVDESLQLGE